MKRLSTWGTFGKGWSNRVAGVREDALHMIAFATPSNSPTEPVSPSPKPSDTQEATKPVSAPRRGGWLVLGIIAAGSAIAAFVNWLVSLFT